MKIDDLLRGVPAIEESLRHPRSRLADPPITREEAVTADISVCCRHNGRIKTDPLPTDIEGRVYRCPVGDELWRYSKDAGGLKLPPRKYCW